MYSKQYHALICDFTAKLLFLFTAIFARNFLILNAGILKFTPIIADISPNAWYDKMLYIKLLSKMYSKYE